MYKKMTDPMINIIAGYLIFPYYRVNQSRSTAYILLNGFRLSFLYLI